MEAKVKKSIQGYCLFFSTKKKLLMHSNFDEYINKQDYSIWKSKLFKNCLAKKIHLMNWFDEVFELKIWLNYTFFNMKIEDRIEDRYF